MEITQASGEMISISEASDVHVPMIFVLAVLIVSLSTDGYFYGMLAAVVSVIGVNYAFTYPEKKLLRITGRLLSCVKKPMESVKDSSFQSHFKGNPIRVFLFLAVFFALSYLHMAFSGEL